MTNERRSEIFSKILRMDTTGGNETLVSDYIAGLFAAYPEVKVEKVKYAENRDQLIVNMSGGEPGKKLGFSGHMDVVPTGNLKWIYPPFEAQEVDGRIYARGATDMKSGLAAMVCAMLELLDEKKTFKGDIRLLATVGEETSAIGSEQLAQLGYGNDLDGLLISEPSGFQVGVAHQGALWVRVTAHGKTAHGSMPQMGVNALDHMILFINEFKKRIDFSKYKSNLTGGSTGTLTILNGGKATNVVPDECVAEFDIRTAKGHGHDELRSQIQEIIDDLTKDVPNFQMTIEYINDLETVGTSPEDILVQLVCQASEKHTGQQATPIGGAGYTDASRFVAKNPKLPVVLFGPGQPQISHQPDEWVETKEYLAIIDSFKWIALEYLK